MIDAIYAEELFNNLYAHINGYNISNKARADFDGDTQKMLYGELPFETWRKIVEFANPRQEGNFYDLGSGTGRVVLQSHLLFNFKKCVGIELLDGLHDKAIEVKNIFNQKIRPQIQDHLEGRQLDYQKANIFDAKLHDADLILMNHPFKDGDDFLRLEEKFLNELKPGTKIVTIIRALKNPGFKYHGKQTFKFSWGDSTAHFAEV